MLQGWIGIFSCGTGTAETGRTSEVDKARLLLSRGSGRASEAVTSVAAIPERTSGADVSVGHGGRGTADVDRRLESVRSAWSAVERGLGLRGEGEDLLDEVRGLGRMGTMRGDSVVGLGDL